MAPTIIFNTYCVSVQQALLFNFSKWLLLISHFTIRSLQVQTVLFNLVLNLKILGGGLSPLLAIFGGAIAP